MKRMMFLEESDGNNDTQGAIAKNTSVLLKINLDLLPKDSDEGSIDDWGVSTCWTCEEDDENVMDDINLQTNQDFASGGQDGRSDRRLDNDAEITFVSEWN